MELEQSGFSDVPLMEGERVDSALNLTDDRSRDSRGDREVILLTDRRVIHLSGSGKHRRAVFASIGDIDVVEVSTEQRGSSAYVWAALAFLASVLLFLVLSDHPLGRFAAAATVALMGVYLVFDQLSDPGQPVLTFRTGSSQLRCSVETAPASADIYTFANRLFQLKSENGTEDVYRGNHFAPR